MNKQNKSNKLLEYKKLAKTHTNQELAELLGVNVRTIRRYASETGIKYKTNIKKRPTKDQWYVIAEKELPESIKIINVERKAYRIIGTFNCEKCGHTWEARLSDKLVKKTGCINCEKGNRVEKHTYEEVKKMLDESAPTRWKIIKYEKFSEKTTIIQCMKCLKKQTVKMSTLIYAQTGKCKYCETFASFGEYCISKVFDYNKIKYEPQYVVKINNKNLRFDFYLSDHNIMIEYNGQQHYDDTSLFYNDIIQQNMELKKEWCEKQNITLIEIPYTRKMKEIIKELSDKILPLETPTIEYFEQTTHTIRNVLNDLETMTKQEVLKKYKITSYMLNKYKELSLL